MAAIIKKKHKIILWIVMAVYLIFLFYFLFFSEAMGRKTGVGNYRYNLILFKEIGRFFTYWETVGFLAAFLNIGGNVIAFVPFGCLMATLLNPKEKWYVVALFSLELSVCVELVQLCTKLGCFDVDDLLLNTVGGFIGYIIYWIWKKLSQAQQRREKQ